MPYTVTVQVFTTYTVGDDGSITAEVDLGDPDLDFAIGTDEEHGDLTDAEHAAVAALRSTFPRTGYVRQTWQADPAKARTLDSLPPLVEGPARPPAR